MTSSPQRAGTVLQAMRIWTPPMTQMLSQSNRDQPQRHRSQAHGGSHLPQRRPSLHPRGQRLPPNPPSACHLPQRGPPLCPCDRHHPPGPARSPAALLQSPQPPPQAGAGNRSRQRKVCLLLWFNAEDWVAGSWCRTCLLHSSQPLHYDLLRLRC